MKALLLLACLLAGCASTPVTTRVEIPTPVVCLAPIPDRPAMPTDALTSGAKLYTFVTAAQAEITLREGYEGQLLQALQSCTKKP